MSDTPTATLPSTKPFLRASSEACSYAAALLVAVQLSYGVASPPRVRDVHDASTEPPASARSLDRVAQPTEGVRALWQAFTDASVLRSGWDGDAAEPPNAAALENMRLVLEGLISAGLVPHRLNADVDGGLSAYFFFQGQGHVSVHCDNEGAVVLVDDHPASAVHAVEIDAHSPDVIEALIVARSEARARSGDAA